MAKKVALLIGVSEYAEGLPPLPATPNDVRRMQQVLQDADLGNFDVTPLINPNFQEMQVAIHNLFADSKRDDLVLFYYAGHGITDENGTLFLAAFTTRQDKFQATAVPASFVHQQMNNSFCKRQIIILDCCYSGAFPEGLRARNDGFVSIREQLGREGSAVLSSSSATKLSFETEGSGIYTRYLVEGIETGAADLNNDGWISVDELHEYAEEKVKEVRPTMQPQICFPAKEGHKIFISQVRVNDRQVLYRRLVEDLASDGEISEISRDALDVKREELGLSIEQANEIEDDALKPFRQRKQKLDRYEQKLIQTIRKQGSLSDRNRRELKVLQQALGLINEDVEPIHQRLIRQKNNASARRMRLTKPWQLLIFLGITAFLIIFIFVVFLPNYQAGILFNKAGELKDSKQNEAALNLYDQVIQLKPNFVYKAWTDRGYVLGQLHRHRESLESCEQAIKLKPNEAFAWNCKGIAHKKLGEYDQAIQAFNRATELDPEFADAFNNKGETRLEKQEYPTAIDDFERAIKIDPKFVVAWNNKGKTYLQTGEFSKAVDAFKTATELQPNSYTAWIGLGDAYKQDKQDDQAKAAYKQATSIQPKSPEDWYYIGQAQERLGQPKEALAAYEEAINIRPNYKLAIEARQRLQKQQ